MAHDHTHPHDPEKLAPLQTSNAASTITIAGTNHPQSEHHAHLHHAGRRLRHFLRPDGRKVHIVHSPDEAEKLKKDIIRRKSEVVGWNSGNTTEKGGDDGSGDLEYDIVVHGSVDHITALRETHLHHEQARENLRIKHGKEFDEFERVVKELDRLSTELHMVSEHAVQLDANFEKYGYSAHLRTHNGNSSSASSTYVSDFDHADEHESTHEHYKQLKNRGTPMLFWKKPIMRQYFHKGLLWRAQEAQEVASYELFVDLFYVGIIAIAGDGAAEEATGQALLRFAITFILSWKFWSDISQMISWFDADDVMRRITTLFILTCLLGLTVNIAGSSEQTYTPMIAFYLASRWFVALYYLWMAYLIPMVRGAMISTAISTFIPGLIWIGSIHVEEPNRQALIWIAIALDIFGPVFLVTFMRSRYWLNEGLRCWSETTFDFLPGQNIEHKIERTNAFVTLVFGYSVVALLYQSAVPFGLNAFFGKAVLGLIQAFTFNWLYFEIDTFNMHTHAIRRHFFSSIVWLAAHLPFILAFALSGSALSKLVLAHDTAHANAEELREPYSGRSEEHISMGLRWFYCAGLSIALMNMGIISLTHTFKEIPSVRLRRPFRLAIRFVVAIAIMLLPLAEERLNSLELVATTTSLVLLVLLVELAGSACVEDAFWGFNSGKRKCTYSAKCLLSKKELHANAKSGEIVNVEEVAKRDQFEGKAGFSV